MTPRRMALLATAVAVPAAVVVLVSGPLLSPQPSPPLPTAATGATDTPRPTGSPTATPTATATPEPITRTITVTEERTRGPFGNRIRPAGVWTGEEVVVWGGWIGRRSGVGPPQPDGAAYNPATDQWRRLPEAPIPPSAGAIGTWTGREVLIWGGVTARGQGRWPVGAAYDPATNTWRTMARAPVRFGFESAAVWTGDEWVFGVERRDAIHFAAYDPATDTWRRLPDLPGDTDEHRLLWTGSEILFSSFDGLFRLAPGAPAWLPSADQVTAQETSGLVVVDGRIIGLRGELGLIEWDPASDTWDPIAVPPRPVQGFGIPGITGDRLVFGAERDGHVLDLVFDLGSSTWSELSWPEPEHRSDEIAIWARDELFVWGGWVGGPTGRPAYQYGVLYTPAW